MGKYIDGSGLAHFMGIIKGWAVPNTRKVNGHALSADVTVTASDIGVAAGAEVNQNAFSNVKVGGTTVAADTKTDTIELVAGNGVTLTPDATNDKVTVSLHTGTAASSGFSYADDGTLNIIAVGSDNNGLMTPALLTKLNGIATGAEVNQNAFSNVKVGSSIVSADIATDTLELVAGSNISITTNTTSNKVHITATDTTALGSMTGTLGVGHGGTGVSTLGAGVVYHSASGTGALSIATATDLVNAIGSKAVARAAADGAGNNIATTYATKTELGTATAGALQYKGVVDAESTITGASYKKGWYYVVGTAGTYVGKTCEVGDMLIAKQDKSSTVANDWDAVQSNIEVLSNSEIDTLWAAA